jgi:hypothetical protein
MPNNGHETSRDIALAAGTTPPYFNASGIISSTTRKSSATMPYRSVFHRTCTTRRPEKSVASGSASTTRIALATRRAPTVAPAARNVVML